MNGQLKHTPAWAQTRACFNILNLRQRDTAIHSVLVSTIALEIGAAMNIGRVELEQLHMGALLHDIGKLAIPDAILSKPTKLDNSERDIIMQHPVIGYNLIGCNQGLSGAMHVILGHHERYDGLGYPLGLKGEDIHLLARICAVADALAAMVLKRSYQKRIPISSALDEVQRCKGTQFDPGVVDTLNLIDVEKIVGSFSLNKNSFQALIDCETGTGGVLLEKIKKPRSTIYL